MKTKTHVCHCGDHAWFRFGKFKIGTADVADRTLIETARWSSNRWYAVAGRRTGRVLLHRAILSAPSGFVVDHIDRNESNNKRSNLRMATPANNQWNRKKQRSSSMPFKGIEMRDGRPRPYRAVVYVDNKRVRGNYRATAREAAEDYDAMAAEYHGDYARTNKMLGLL